MLSPMPLAITLGRVSTLHPYTMCRRWKTINGLRSTLSISTVKRDPKSMKGFKFAVRSTIPHHTCCLLCATNGLDPDRTVRPRGARRRRCATCAPTISNGFLGRPLTSAPVYDGVGFITSVEGHLGRSIPAALRGLECSSSPRPEHLWPRC